MNAEYIDLEIQYNDLIFTPKIQDESVIMMFKYMVRDVLKEIYINKFSFISYPVLKEEYRKLFEEILSSARDLFMDRLNSKLQELKELLGKNNVINYAGNRFIINEVMRKKLIQLINQKNIFLRIFGKLIYPFVQSRDNRIKI
ncbi:MAG: hypothetical protein QXD03_04905 [Candidatus Anstonellales archaeon]